MRLFGKQEFSAAEKDTIRQLLEQKLGKEHLSERAGAAGSMQEGKNTPHNMFDFLEFVIILDCFFSSRINCPSLGKYTYVESWKAIQLANQIFGFNGWSSSVVDVAPDFVC